MGEISTAQFDSTHGGKDPLQNLFVKVILHLQKMDDKICLERMYTSRVKPVNLGDVDFKAVLILSGMF